MLNSLLDGFVPHLTQVSLYLPLIPMGMEVGRGFLDEVKKITSTILCKFFLSFLLIW